MHQSRAHGENRGVAMLAFAGSTDFAYPKLLEVRGLSTPGSRPPTGARSSVRFESGEDFGSAERSHFPKARGQVCASFVAPHGPSVTEPEVAANAVINDVDRRFEPGTTRASGHLPHGPFAGQAQLNFVSSAAWAIEQSPLRRSVRPDQVEGARRQHPGQVGSADDQCRVRVSRCGPSAATPPSGDQVHDGHDRSRKSGPSPRPTYSGSVQ